MLTIDMKDAADPEPSPSVSPRVTSPSPTAIKTPSRVETGRGGTARDGTGILLAGIALVARLAVAGAALTRRHS